MLTLTALRAAYPLAVKADNNNLMVVPVENTPLASLVAASNIGIESIQQTDDGYQLDMSGAVYVANSPNPVLTSVDSVELPMAEFTKALDNVSGVAIAAVTEQIAFTKLTVIPFIKSILDGVDKGMARIIDKAPTYDIKLSELPALLSSESFVDEVVKFSSAARMNCNLNMRCPTLTYTELLDLLKIGNTSVDKEIQTWAELQGQEWLLNVWTDIFTQQGKLSNGTLNDFFMGKNVDINVILAVFLLARRMTFDTPKGIEMNLSAFTNLADDFRNLAAKVLTEVLEREERHYKHGSLVLNSDDGVITVHGRLYNAWLADGGDPDILFGNMLTKRYVGITDLKENAPALLQEWNRHINYANTLKATRRLASLRDVIKHAYRMVLVDDFRLALKEGEAFNGDAVNKIMDKVNVAVDTATEHTLRDIPNFVMEVVCATRFYDCDAIHFLRGMNEAQANNPGLEPRESYAVATIKYVANWVALQLKTKPN